MSEQIAINRLPLRFRTIREQIEETLASGRKEGEFMGLITQQPEQAQRAADLFPALRSLVATKMWLADPAAEEEAYLRLRNESRRLRRPMKDLAEAIILAEDLARKSEEGS